MKSLFISTLVFLVLLVNINAQKTLQAAEQKAVVEALAKSLEDHYVFPKEAKEMAQLIRQKLEKGAYHDKTDALVFADQLTTDIRAINQDLHLRVNYNPNRAKALRQPPSTNDNPARNNSPRRNRNNFGFQEVKMLEGNIGYLDLRGFFPPSLAGETATAAMNFLSNADAIIFDLRNNGGGSPAMIQLLTSYLYSARDRIHLNSFYNRPTDDTTQTWTLPYVPGKRNPEAEVLVLTSGFTFSAAEEFSYNLKHLNRATLVGETTGGGAHPGGTHAIDQNFVAFIPNGRAINPNTHTNWEGTGVKPHVEIASDKALEKAHYLALKKLREKAETEADQQYFDWYKDIIHAKTNPIKPHPDKWKAYAGTYGPRKLSFENNQLYYQRTGRAKTKLKALSQSSFMIEGVGYFKMEVEEKDGAYYLIAKYQDGRVERVKKEAVKP